MADWKRIAKAALLSDGRIDTKETEILSREIFADQNVDKAELEFLADLRRSATGVVRAFTELFHRAVVNHILADGTISDAEAKWLCKSILADGRVDADEIQLLKDLKAGAKSVGEEFTKLFDECVK